MNLTACFRHLSRVSAAKRVANDSFRFLFCCCPFRSIIILVVLLAIDIADFYALENRVVHGYLPNEWQGQILIAHALCFYLFFVGLVYVIETQELRLLPLAIAVFVMWLTAFILRIVFHFKFSDYYPIAYLS